MTNTFFPGKVQRVVGPEGSPTASIVILGEAPTGEEARIGKAFASSAGRLLFDDILGHARILRSECLTLYTHWESVPTNALGSVSDFIYHAQTWEAINRHPRAVIIAVGEHALRFTTGKEGITKWRGSVLTGLQGHTVIPMIAPSAVIRQYSWKYLCRFDALKAARVAAGEDLSEPEGKRKIMTYATLKDEFNGDQESMFTAMRDEILSYESKRFCSFDIETIPKLGVITCVGLAKSISEGVVLPLTGEFPRGMTIELVRALGCALEGSALKVGQNLDYDVQWLANKLGLGVRNVWMDTMVAHSVMHPEMGHSLDLLTSIYTNHPYFKDMRKEAESDQYNALLWRYNGLDCCITLEVAFALAKELRDTKCWDHFHSIAMPATKTLVRMEAQGIRIDEKLREQRLIEMEAEKTSILGDPVLQGLNPNSSKQVAGFLTEQKIKLPKKRGAKSVSADVHALKSVRNKKPEFAPFIDKVLHYRELSKITGTYLKAKAHPDQRMRTSFRTSATDTGRISSSKDVFDFGMNLQNVPYGQRDWFIPDPGMIMWDCDASQIEARITAWIAKDEDYVRGFIEKRDLHTENAMSLFGLDDPDRVHDNIEGTTYSYRDVGKRATHAMNYKVGPGKLKDLMNEYVPQLPFSQKDAKEFIATFKRIRPGLARWWLRIEEKLKRDRVFYTAFGRRRIFLSRLDDNLVRAAVAFEPQSTAADHINAALVRIESRIKEENLPASVLLQVHDSIGGQCAPEYLDVVKSIVVEEMEKPIPLEYEGIPLIVPADFGSGLSWKDCK